MQIVTFTKSKIRIILYGISTFATMVVAAPSLAAITHWFAPFPPKPIRNSDPKIVSPGLKQAIKRVCVGCTLEICRWQQQGPWRWRRWTRWRRSYSRSRPSLISLDISRCGRGCWTHTPATCGGTSFKFIMFTCAVVSPKIKMPQEKWKWGARIFSYSCSSQFISLPWPFFSHAHPLSEVPRDPLPPMFIFISYLSKFLVHFGGDILCNAEMG